MASDAPAESPVMQQPTSLSPMISTKKARRQTAFYPNINSSNKPQNPFSRSAAKRESVMALGSIEHLQHYFTKTGIAAKKNPLKPSSNLVPAIGPGVILTDASSEREEEHSFILPPSPMVPPPLPPSFPPFVKTYQTDPEVLKPGVIEDLEAVERAWGIGSHAPKPRHPELLGDGAPLTDVFDVLSTLKTTTRAIRSVRNYLVALPDDFATPRPQHAEFRPHSLSPLPGSVRKVSHPDAPNDPLTLIRRSALEVLTVLRNIEEEARVPLSDDVYDAQSDAGSTSTRSHTPGGTERVASPFTTTSGDDEESTASFSFSVVKAPSHKTSIPVWSDEDDGGEYDETTEKREHWDERLVLGGGWLYRQDISLESLTKECEAIENYLDAVDQVLFGRKEKESCRGWVREKERLAMVKDKETKGSKGRRASAGDGDGQNLSKASGRGRRIVSAEMADAMRDMILTEEPDDILQSVAEETGDEDSIDDSLLPDWAKHSKFTDQPLARTLSLLVTLLPTELLPLLPPPNSSDLHGTLLLTLSSGQILCTAYNAAVRKSREPWGYINRTAIHDIAALEAEESVPGGDMEKRKGWTFRRTDNLRLWAGALKLRYLIPLVLPRASHGGTPVSSPSATQLSFSGVELPVLFDPQLVARRGEGWDQMLEVAVLRWMWCVVGEQRKSK